MMANLCCLFYYLFHWLFFFSLQMAIILHDPLLLFFFYFNYHPMHHLLVFHAIHLLQSYLNFPFDFTLQVLTCSPTARMNARPWVTPTAAGCRPLCHQMGARGRTTAAIYTSLAWTPHCPTLRYPPPSTSPINSPWPPPPPRPTIGHSLLLARTAKDHSHTTAFKITSISNSSSTAPAR